MINRTPLTSDRKIALENIASSLTQAAATQYAPSQDNKNFVQWYTDTYYAFLNRLIDKETGT